MNHELTYQEAIDIVERLRKKLARNIIIFIALMAFFIASFTAGDTMQSSVTVLRITLGAGMAVCLLAGILPARKRYVSQYKALLVERALKDYFEDLQFIPTSCITRETIAATDMMQLGNIYNGNDLISGKYNTIPFVSSDVYIADESTDSEGNTTTTEYFRGRWMIFEFNKSFKYNLQVSEKGFSYSKRSRTTGKMTKVKMESSEFNKSFNVYASSELEAFYILTPHIISSMMNMNINVKGKMLFCFHNDKLHVAVNNGADSFEPSAFKALTMSKVNKDILGEIKIITSFIEELRLDRKIWTS